MCAAPKASSISVSFAADNCNKEGDEGNEEGEEESITGDFLQLHERLPQKTAAKPGQPPACAENALYIHIHYFMNLELIFMQCTVHENHSMKSNTLHRRGCNALKSNYDIMH